MLAISFRFAFGWPAIAFEDGFAFGLLAVTLDDAFPFGLAAITLGDALAPRWPAIVCEDGLAFDLLAVTLDDAFAFGLLVIASDGELALGWPVITCEDRSVLACSGSAKAADVRESAAKAPRMAHHLIIIFFSKKLKNFVLPTNAEKAGHFRLDHQNVPSAYCDRGQLANRKFVALSLPLWLGAKCMRYSGATRARTRPQVNGPPDAAVTRCSTTPLLAGPLFPARSLN